MKRDSFGFAAATAAVLAATAVVAVAVARGAASPTHVRLPDDAELAAFLRNSDDLDEACSLLIRRALAAGSRDNITVVLAKNDGGNA